jgi:hypothetical protein
MHLEAVALAIRQICLFSVLLLVFFLKDGSPPSKYSHLFAFSFQLYFGSDEMMW